MEHFEDDILVELKPKKDLAFESATRKFPDLSPEDKAFLFASIQEILEDDEPVHEISVAKWDALCEKMKYQVLAGENASLAGALIEYIRLCSIGDHEKLFYLIGPLDDFYRSLYIDNNESSIPKGASVSIAKILSQDRIWNVADRSNTVALFHMLGFYDLENLPDEEKAEIGIQMNAFINGVKKIRFFSRQHCVNDIEKAIEVKQRMYDYDMDIVVSADQIIATETDDIGWPYEPNFIEPEERESYDDDWGIDDAFHEDIHNPSKFSKEFVNGKVVEAKKLAEVFKSVPEKMKPALQLHYFNNLIDEERGFGTNFHDEVQEENILKRYIEDERLAEENIYLPTVGLEIEVPYGFKIDKELCEATRDLGVPQAGSGYGATNEAWEFATDFSYSAKTQALIARELIRGDFIETEGSDQAKKIRGSGDFSMHLNLGLPLDLADKINDDSFFKTVFKARADVLVNALTYAFVSPKRLIYRKTNNRLSIDKNSKRSKDKNRPFKSGEYEGDSVLSGRLELRSLEARDFTLYRLVPEAQVLAAALFSSSLDNRDKNQELLKTIWEDFSGKVLDIFQQFNLTLNTVDENSLKAADILEETDIQKKLRSLITDTTQAINKVIA